MGSERVDDNFGFAKDFFQQAYRLWNDYRSQAMNKAVTTAYNWKIRSKNNVRNR